MTNDSMMTEVEGTVASALSGTSFVSRPTSRSKATAAKVRHITQDETGQLCMTVVDPVTRKMLIPLRFIYETRAQQRSTLPSLCQLFLNNRCRQGDQCHQVHADWGEVQALRGKVDSLPFCCVEHGDMDRAGVLMNNIELAEYASQKCTPNCLQDIVLYIPECTSYYGYLPLRRVSYTVALKRLLENQCPLERTDPPTVSLPCPLTGGEVDMLVLDGAGSTVCRLHATDRCRYAEECKFLHLCKEVTRDNPHLAMCDGKNTNRVATRAQGARSRYQQAEPVPGAKSLPATQLRTTAAGSASRYKHQQGHSPWAVVCSSDPAAAISSLPCTVNAVSMSTQDSPLLVPQKAAWEAPVQNSGSVFGEPEGYAHSVHLSLPPHSTMLNYPVCCKGQEEPSYAMHCHSNTTSPCIPLRSSLTMWKHNPYAVGLRMPDTSLYGNGSNMLTNSGSGERSMSF